MEKYWYFLLPAILISLIPPKAIDRAAKKWIPDDKKRAKFFMGFLIVMCVFYTVMLFLLTANMPWHIRIPLSVFPLAGVGIGFFLGKYCKK